MIESASIAENQQIIKDLKRIPTLDAFDDTDLSTLLEFCRFRKYKAGERIIAEGDFDGNVYVLIYGQIRVEKKGKTLTTLDQRGEIFGEMSFLGEFSRTASIYANDDVACLAIDNANMDQTHGKEKSPVYYILYQVFTKILAERLKATSDELIHVKSKYLKFW